MIHFSCDRCGVALGSPVDSAQHPMMEQKDAEKGVAVMLPMKNSLQNYCFQCVHFCERCLGELAAWAKAKSAVDQSLVDDR